MVHNSAFHPLVFVEFYRTHGISVRAPDPLRRSVALLDIETFEDRDSICGPLSPLFDFLHID